MTELERLRGALKSYRSPKDEDVTLVDMLDGTFDGNEELGYLAEHLAKALSPAPEPEKCQEPGCDGTGYVGGETGVSPQDPCPRCNKPVEPVRKDGLLPCPFCGHTDSLYITEGHAYQDRISCAWCKTMGPLSVQPRPMWNRRTQADAEGRGK